MPAVSVAIPAYNSESWVAEAVHSALEQTVGDIEVIVVDDASTDDTYAAVAAIDDSRLRLYRNDTNLGEAENWNKSVSLCRGRLVKLLCSDDLLHSDCIEKLSTPFSHPSVGIVFSRRKIVGDAGRAAYYGSGHTRLGKLREVNNGRSLFELYMSRRFDDNWIGEPSSVMLRRDVFKKARFDSRIVRTDMAMWIRVMFHYDIGFVDEELVTYRVRPGSVTDVASTSGSRWLDWLWLYESLLADPAIKAKYGAEIRRLLRRERTKAAAKLLAYRGDRGRWKDAAGYLRQMLQ